MFDSNKRKTLKWLAAAPVALSALPMISNACDWHEAHLQAKAENPLRSADIQVSFAKSANHEHARRVIIRNLSDSTVTLRHIEPGVVSTKQGVYDLNALLKSPMVLAAGEKVELEVMPQQQAASAIQYKGLHRNSGSVQVVTEHQTFDGVQQVSTWRTLIG